MFLFTAPRRVVGQNNGPLYFWTLVSKCPPPHRSLGTFAIDMLYFQRGHDRNHWTPFSQSKRYLGNGGQNREVSHDCINWILSTIKKLCLRIVTIYVCQFIVKICDKMHIIYIFMLSKYWIYFHDIFGGKSCMLHKKCRRNFQHSHRF